MAMMKKVGYGQVEPNHLSAQRTGQVYAQTPAKEIEVLENGCFLKRDVKKGELNVTADTKEWFLVMNEVKNYGERQGLKNFRLEASKTVGGEIVPRVYKVNVGDIFTTNLIDGDSLKVGDELTIKAGTEEPYTKVGILTKGVADEGAPKYSVMKVTTMPDGQAACKVIRVL